MGLPRNVGFAQPWATNTRDTTEVFAALEHRFANRWKLRLNVTHSKSDEFSVPTCKRLTSHGRFHPALDAKGQPVRAFYLGSISWKA